MDIKMDNLEQLIKQYVLGQLGEADAESFEEYFLSRPDIAEQIETAQNLHLGLGQLELERSENRLPSAQFADAERSTGVFLSRQPLLARFSHYLVGPAQSLTMAVMLLVLVPLALTSMLGQTGPMTAQLVRLDSATVRSSVAQSNIALPTDGSYAAVMVRVRDVEFPSYRLLVESDKEWRSAPFSFAAGLRDHLVLIPPSATGDSAQVSLLGISPDGDERVVDFCNYTEACL